MNKTIPIICLFVAVGIIASTLIILDQLKSENYLFSLTDVSEIIDAGAWEIRGYTPDTTNEISLFIYNENGMLITQDKIFANPSGEFSTVITTGGPLFTAGTYTLIANQTGNTPSQVTTSFELTNPSIPVGDFDATFGGPGNRHPAFLGYEIPEICTEDMIKHLVKHSNMFFADEENFFIDSIGLPDSVNEDNYDVCLDELLELREEPDNRVSEPVKIKVCRGEYIPEWCGEGNNP